MWIAIIDNINPAFSVPASTTRTFCNNAQDSIVLIDMAAVSV